MNLDWAKIIEATVLFTLLVTLSNCVMLIVLLRERKEKREHE